MTARIIDGKALAREVEAQARARSEALASRPGGRRPGLAVVLVGEDRLAASMSKTKPAPANVPASFQPNTASRPKQQRRSCSN